MKSRKRAYIDDCIKPAHWNLLLGEVPLYRLCGPLSNVCGTIVVLVESKTMTDNDDPAPPRAHRSSNGLGKGTLGEGVTEPSGQRAVRWALRSGAHVGPTDPAVPNAKRRGELRRRRSLVALSALVIGLLSITLALLYRASQRVGMPNPKSNDLPAIEGTRADIDVSAANGVIDETLTRAAPTAPVEPGSELGDDAPAYGQTSTDSAPAGSAAPMLKGPAPALDIIRTPAF
jgi:hypothetical protein